MLYLLSAFLPVLYNTNVPTYLNTSHAGESFVIYLFSLIQQSLAAQPRLILFTISIIYQHFKRSHIYNLFQTALHQRLFIFSVTLLCLPSLTGLLSVASLAVIHRYFHNYSLKPASCLLSFLRLLFASSYTRSLLILSILLILEFTEY